MDKGELLVTLYNNIKDEIEFDSDVEALESILNKMLEIDDSTSFKWWNYIVTRYDINNLDKDIEFEPIFNNYLNNLLQKIGIEKFFEQMNTLSTTNRNLAYSHFFNIFNIESGILKYMENCILKSNSSEEKETIQLIEKNIKDISKDIFDIYEFVKKIILIHIKHNKIDIKFLIFLSEIPKNIKEQAVLKTLLIDYL